MLRALDGVEVDHEGDRVLSLGNAVVRLAGRDSGGSAGYHTGGDGNILQDPAADIDVM